MAKPELYVSIDIETDGPAPGLNSMLALGAAAFDESGDELGTWYATMSPLAGSTQDPDTMKWWATQPEARAEVLTDVALPRMVIPGFVAWCDEFARNFKLIAVGWPIAFDFAFVNYYCHKFAGHNPLGFAGLDIRSYASGLTGQSSYYGIREKAIRELTGEVDTTGLRPHVAVDDAIEQGRLFMSLRRHALGLAIV